MSGPCEWCWSRAFMREFSDPSKSQPEHYSDILAEQNARGADAECPEAAARARKVEEGR